MLVVALTICNQSRTSAAVRRTRFLVTTRRCRHRHTIRARHENCWPRRSIRTDLRSPSMGRTTGWSTTHRSSRRSRKCRPGSASPRTWRPRQWPAMPRVVQKVSLQPSGRCQCDTDSAHGGRHCALATTASGDASDDDHQSDRPPPFPGIQLGGARTDERAVAASFRPVR